LIGTGLLVTALSLYEMAGYTLDTAPWTIVRTGFVQGCGFGLIFVPLSTVTFATLPPPLRTEATAIFSLMRNIGSSIGISIAISLLASNTQVMHASLAAHITPFNPQLIAPGIGAFWNPWTAPGLAALNAEVTRQATVVAYADDYLLMLWLTLLALPMLLLMRRPGKGGGAGAHAVVAD
jgi:DHA2 family multidrug resistance protein